MATDYYIFHRTNPQQVGLTLDEHGISLPDREAWTLFKKSSFDLFSPDLEYLLETFRRHGCFVTPPKIEC